MKLESDTIRDSQAAVVDNMINRYDWDSPHQTNLCKEHDMTSTCSRFTEVVLQVFQGNKTKDIRSTVLECMCKANCV